MDCGEMDLVESEKQEAMDPFKPEEMKAMDPFESEEMKAMDPFKPEEMKATMKKVKRNRKAKKLLRYAIVAVSAVLLSWSSVWIPVVFQTATLYFRFACTVIASQKFVFFMCNAIILTLAVKSGQLSPSNSGPDIYDEFVSRKYAASSESAVPEPEQVPEEEKRCVLEESAALPEEEEEEPKAEEFAETMEIEPAETKEVVQVEVKRSKPGKVGRSLSGIIDRKPKRKPKLRRSETGIEKVDNPPEDGENSNSIVPASDSVESNDDFNKRIDDFIRKQQMLRRQESLAVVVP